MPEITEVDHAECVASSTAHIFTENSMSYRTIKFMSLAPVDDTGVSGPPGSTAGAGAAPVIEAAVCAAGVRALVITAPFHHHGPLSNGGQ
ncbi:hypothetical protein [Mycobacterium pseudokansasii]|uniref:hypothetical protein n=1 Tax=Mycobacterium pseudokansasii TaxID=2341080 RepID=UPI000C082EDC|nr:hypothetical protein [Mycobacterium pseudokansasii]